MKKTSRGVSKLGGLLVLCLAALLAIAVAAAVTVYFFPQTGNVHGNVSVTFTLNGTAWTNGSAFDWGLINPGAFNNVSLNVYNAGNTNASLTLLPQTFPSVEWNETWTLNATVIHPTETLNGTLSLYVPVSWPPGNVTLPPILIEADQV